MLIDWFTVAAQVVNFLVLLWLMKRFLYKPILAAIDVREKRIADQLADAGRQTTAAQGLRQDLLAKTRAFDGERAGLLAAAVATAGVEHDRLCAAARTEAEAARLQERAASRTERSAQTERMNDVVTTEVFAIARRALGDLAGIDVEERMVSVWIERLHELAPDARAAWVAALQADTAGGLVRSRYELTAPTRGLIQAAVNDSGPSRVPLRFETAAQSPCGIEVLVQGQRIAWTIADYLQSLQSRVEALAVAS